MLQLNFFDEVARHETNEVTEADCASDKRSLDYFVTNDRVGMKVYDSHSKKEKITTIELASSYETGPTVAAEQFWANWLKNRCNAKYPKPTSTISFIDLFSGCGGLSLAFSETVRVLGRKPACKAAFDLDDDSLKTFSANFPSAQMHRSKRLLIKI